MKYKYKVEYYLVNSIEFPPVQALSAYAKNFAPGELYKGLSIINIASGEEVTNLIPVMDSKNEEDNISFPFNLPDSIGEVKYDIKKVDINDLSGLEIEADSYLKAAQWIEEDSVDDLLFISEIFSHEYLPKVAGFMETIKKVKELPKIKEEESEEELTGTDFEGNISVSSEEVLDRLDEINLNNPSLFAAIINTILSTSTND